MLFAVAGWADVKLQSHSIHINANLIQTTTVKSVLKAGQKKPRTFTFPTKTARPKHHGFQYKNTHLQTSMSESWYAAQCSNRLKDLLSAQSKQKKSRAAIYASIVLIWFLHGNQCYPNLSSRASDPTGSNTSHKFSQPQQDSSSSFHLHWISYTSKLS